MVLERYTPATHEAAAPTAKMTIRMGLERPLIPRPKLLEPIVLVAEEVRRLVQHGDADLLGQLLFAGRLTFQVALEEVDDVHVRRPVGGRLLRHRHAGEHAQHARVDAVEHHLLGRPVGDQHRHVGQPLQHLRGQLAESLLRHALELLAGHHGPGSGGRGVEAQHSEPLANGARAVAFGLEDGPEQVTRVGLFGDLQTAAGQHVAHQPARAFGVAELVEVQLGGADPRPRVAGVGVGPAAVGLERGLGLLMGQGELRLELEDLGGFGRRGAGAVQRRRGADQVVLVQTGPGFVYVALEL